MWGLLSETDSFSIHYIEQINKTKLCSGPALPNKGGV